jgi:uncharacterized membrane protein YccC
VGEPPIAIWIAVFLVGAIVGRWWLSIVAGVAVFAVIAVATDPGPGSVEVGFLVGVAVFITLLCAIALRSLVVSLVRDALDQRRKRRHLDEAAQLGDRGGSGNSGEDE